MNRQLLKKINEALFSVLPVALIVIILNFTPLISLSNTEIFLFIFSAIFLILGIGLFNLGADLAMTPMGEQIGVGLTKSKKIGLLLILAFSLGFLITIAEPDLSALASQVSKVINSTLIIILVGFGVGLFLLIGVLKIIFKKSLSSLLTFFYMTLFSVASIVIIKGNINFLPLAFDSGGVTTGPITVPFIMAFGVGIALTIGGRNANENSFGLISLCSIGPILAVIVLGMFINDNLIYEIPNAYEISSNLGHYILSCFGIVIKDVSIALGLVTLFFFVINFIFLKLPKNKLIQILCGIIFTYIGLIIFLSAVNVGFMPIGYQIGLQLANNKKALVIFAFILGFVVVLAEPAVHVLNNQVENITNGTVSKKSMLIALSVGIGLSIGLSIIRIIFDFSILYYLIPGYFISLGLSFFVPKLYTAIAFDSGGVASGPLTSTFILPFAVGACMSISGIDNVMANAFGVVAMVAMTPLITIQFLGFKAIINQKMREKIALKKILDKSDDQIIDFM